MNENLKAFITLLQKDKALNEKALALADLPEEEKTVAFLDLAAQAGCPLTAEDFSAAKEKELSDAELEAVTGGSDCFCFIGGGGSAEVYHGYNSFTCACVLGGAGEGCDYMTTWEDRACRCWCAAGGSGLDHVMS